jgi:hypothetical protein
MTAPEPTPLPGTCPMHGGRTRYASAGPVEPGCTCKQVAPEPTPYTPPDEEVRAVVARHLMHVPDDDAAREAFDRWLAVHDERVRADERARVADGLRRVAREGSAPVTFAPTGLYGRAVSDVLLGMVANRVEAGEDL